MTPQQAPRKATGKSAPRSRALTRQQRRFTAAHWTWLSVAVVLVVVLALVLIDTVGSNNGNERTSFGLAPASVFDEVTQIPASVYDKVGVSSPVITVGSIYRVSGAQPPLTTTVDGKAVPFVFYMGAEYCPYCAAARWGMIAALSRFGSFDKLYLMKSSGTDVDPNTPSFSFYKTTYTANSGAGGVPLFVFRGYEIQDRNHQSLMTMPAWVNNTVARYNPSGYFPFFDIANKYFIETSVFDPSTLGGVTQAQIAATLTDTSSPITQAIITEANYLTAGICAAVKGAPASVCQSSGVKAATKALPKLPLL